MDPEYSQLPLGQHQILLSGKHQRAVRCSGTGYVRSDGRYAFIDWTPEGDHRASGSLRTVYSVLKSGLEVLTVPSFEEALLHGRHTTSSNALDFVLYDASLSDPCRNRFALQVHEAMLATISERAYGEVSALADRLHTLPARLERFARDIVVMKSYREQQLRREGMFLQKRLR